MSTVFIFHGLEGRPEGIWIPWLKAQLQQEGHQVIAPAFPHADHPSLEEWLQHFSQFEHLLSGQTMFVGHSLGGAFALRLLERLSVPMLATFLVASVAGPMGNELDSLVASFAQSPFDWKTIRRRCARFFVVHSDNDPYIPLSQAQQLAEHLGTAVTLIRGEGHFSVDKGYLKFPLLLEMIRKEWDGN